MRQLTGRTAAWLLGVGAVLMLAAPAMAVPQFTPTAGARLHTPGNGPGATYNTGGATDEVSYDQGTGLLSISAVVDEMNWYDPANGGCATDSVGSNCNLNFGPDLTLSVQAAFQSLTVTPVAGSIVSIAIEFGTAGGTDIMWNDPADGGSTQLGATWQAGTFQGSPTTGLVASLLFDTGSLSVLGQINAVGFATLDVATPYASLFGDPGTERIQLDIVDLTMLTPAIGTLIDTAINTGTLPSFTAEADGQTFRVDAGDFVVPEPATGLLVGMGLAGLAAARRTRR